MTAYQTKKGTLHMYMKFIGAVFLAALLSACTTARQPSSPDASPVPATSLQPASPTTSSQPENGPTKSIGTPVPGWEDIPIMPGAYNSELEEMVYFYSVKETVDQVEEYYQTKMSVNGWRLADRQVMQSSGSSGPATVLDFQKNGRVLNIMLVDVPAENATAVILSQIGQ